jgi:hypothetical protein
MSPEEKTLAVAIEVAREIESLGAPCAVIGAVALAVHGYPRATADLDVATLLPTEAQLSELADALRMRGYVVEVATPDAQDPLGGVVTVVAPEADPVQVINYFNPWNGWAPAGKAALDTAMPDVLGPLAVVDLPHLIALKLYAGGRKSELDVLELLSRHPVEAVAEARDVCKSLRLEAALEHALRGADPTP